MDFSKAKEKALEIYQSVKDIPDLEAKVVAVLQVATAGVHLYNSFMDNMQRQKLCSCCGETHTNAEQLCTSCGFLTDDERFNVLSERVKRLTV